MPSAKPILSTFSSTMPSASPIEHRCHDGSGRCLRSGSIMKTMKRKSTDPSREHARLSSKIPKRQETIREGLQQASRERARELGDFSASHVRREGAAYYPGDPVEMLRLCVDMMDDVGDILEWKQAGAGETITVLREQNVTRETDMVLLQKKLAIEEETLVLVRKELAVEKENAVRVRGELATERERLVRLESESATRNECLIRLQNELAAEKESCKGFADINECLRVEVQDLKSNLRKAEVRIEDQTQKDLCEICFEEPRNALCLPCAHISFCMSCLLKHLRIGRTCPICRVIASGVLECHGLVRQ